MMKTDDILNLKKRYLIWLYKETKEALDRVDRKFTQIEIDKFIREELRKEEIKTLKFFEDFNSYVNNKEKDCATLKSKEGKYLSPEHQFLGLKLLSYAKEMQQLRQKRREFRLFYTTTQNSLRSRHLADFFRQYIHQFDLVVGAAIG